MDDNAGPADPMMLFGDWWTAIQKAGIVEPGAMTLATALPDGTPSARIVLLRGFDERGFLFYTNYQSRKAGELAVNPRAALVLHWAPLERQVRIEGRVEKASAEESDAYFASRPVGHRLGALASPQSQVLPDRADLARRMAELEQLYADKDVPRPASWGGYRVLPEMIEFWQGQPNRLHDRLRYCRHPDGPWLMDRLAP